MKHSSTPADNKQPRSLLILFAICSTCPCYDIPWAMDMAFMLWYLTRDAPSNNNYWPSMSHCSVSRLIILHISGLFHPFIFSQFENEAPRVWADPQKKAGNINLSHSSNLFLTMRIFGFAFSLMYLPEDLQGVMGAWSKILQVLYKCWQNLMNLLDGTNSCQEENLIGWHWNRIDTILNNECIVYVCM